VAGAGGSHRLIEVDAQRVERWVAGFGERHGEVSTHVDGVVVRLRAADGAEALLESPFGDAPPDSADAVSWLTREAARERRAALLLVRRGGYAVGTAQGAALEVHKVGSRYVQGRTAAGGWSQQRFARRRAGQAAGLVDAAADAARTAWSGASPEVLVVGGDRALVQQVLDDPRLGRVAALPRSPLLDVRDPRLDVLRDALRRSRCVRVRLTEPA
jgi:hypothetical protein